MVFIGKASARPAQHRNFEFLQRFHHIGAHTVHVRDIGLFPNVNPLINAATQMLGKMSVNLRFNVPLHIVIIDK